MTFNVEVLLKGKEHIVETVVDFDGSRSGGVGRRRRPARAGADARRVRPGAEPRARRSGPSRLRGFSWIVTPVGGGVAIAIEIPSGAVVAGPFDGAVDTLTATITRVLANARGSAQAH